MVKPSTMRPNDWFKLACRVLGIWQLVDTAGYALSIFNIAAGFARVPESYSLLSRCLMDRVRIDSLSVLGKSKETSWWRRPPSTGPRFRTRRHHQNRLSECSSLSFSRTKLVREQGRPAL